jgi:hypothetical protein
VAEDDHKEDKRILVEMLITIEHRLYAIVSETKGDTLAPLRFRKEFVEMFPGPWHEVENSFRRVRDMIEKDEVRWEYVAGLGMAGPMLRWKKRFFDETVRQGVAGRFLKIANSILGSLSQAVPPLEIVKEYKEHVEAAMKYVRG